MSGRMAGKMALVSGAASSLSAAQANPFARSGARGARGPVPLAEARQGDQAIHMARPSAASKQPAAPRARASSGVDRAKTMAPARIRTPILGDITPARDAAIHPVTAKGSAGDPLGIASSALFSASWQARYIAGAEF